MMERIFGQCQEPGFLVLSPQRGSWGLGVTTKTALSLLLHIWSVSRSCTPTSKEDLDSTHFPCLLLDPGHHHLCLDCGHSLLPGLPQSPTEHSYPTSGRLYLFRCIPDVSDTQPPPQTSAPRWPYQKSAFHSGAVHSKGTVSKSLILFIFLKFLKHLFIFEKHRDRA